MRGREFAEHVSRALEGRISSRIGLMKMKPIYFIAGFQPRFELLEPTLRVPELPVYSQASAQ
jgi:hypothetical protein